MSLQSRFSGLIFLLFSVALPSSASESNHPFLDNTRPIRWSKLTPDKLEADMQEAMRITQTAVEKISRLKPEEITYENTFAALEQSQEPFMEGLQKAFVLKSLCDHPDLRKAMDATTPRVTAYLSSLTKNQVLWNVLKTAETQLKGAKLTSEQRRFIELTIKDFRDNGADLPAEKRARLEVIDKELTEATQQFSNLYMDSRKNWSWSTQDGTMLEGVNPTHLKRAQEEYRSQHPAQTKQGWTFTLDSAAAARIMVKAQREECRKSLWEHYQTVSTGTYDTEPVIRQILALRLEKARLCGYEKYPDYALQDSMAGDGKNAVNFVNNLLAKVKDPFFREMEGLRLLKAKHTNNQKARLNPWDTAYYSNLQAEERFQLDQDELRHYFPLPRVMEGLFSLVNRLYGIRVTEVPADSKEAVETWHPDVRFFKIHDETGKLLGSFYMDLFSRNHKRSGAWMYALDSGIPDTPNTPGKPRVGMVCLNIHPAAEGEPVLLTHYEVTTLFHEFGHLLHLMFTRVSIPSLAGTNVPRDFVEIPSQFMENWCWKPEILKSFARHEQTGAVIPDELLTSLRNSRANTPALSLVGQLLYGQLDLAVHTDPERFATQDLDQIDPIIAGDMDYFKGFKRSSKLRTAQHFFSSPSGYASFYFSYCWAEVMEKDIFEAFERAGGVDKETALRFRKTILERGYTVPPMQQFIDFMGRKPDPDAMLRQRKLAL